MRLRIAIAAATTAVATLPWAVLAAAAAPPAPSATAAAPAAATPGTPAEIRIRRNGDVQELTDARGFTLYTYVKDTQPGQSACLDECARNWPPLQAPAGAQAAGDFAVVQRADGTTQWSYRGQPLYRYTADEYPGATFGDGLRNLWRVAAIPLATPPGIGTGITRAGRVLVDEKGHTLYTLRRDANGKVPACDAKCRGGFVPLRAADLAGAVGDWSTTAAPDGTRQWAWKGSPLFRFRDDRRPGDSHGEAAGKRFVAVVVQPPAAAPDWVRHANADMGIVYALPDGRTVYTFRGNRADIVRRICNEACIRANWQPYYADKQVPPTGDWSVKKGDEGRLQWAYRGALLYTYHEDRRAGDTLGDNFGASWGIDGPWKPILRWQY